MPSKAKKTGKIPMTCPNCGVEFFVFPCRLKRNKVHPICCSHSCGSTYKNGVSNSSKAGQVSEQKNGYTYFYSGEHGVKAKKVHIMLAEKALGGKLKKGEVVHHINCDKSDNRPSNLLICTQSYHAWLHQEMGRRWAKEHLNG